MIFLIKTTSFYLLFLSFIINFIQSLNENGFTVKYVFSCIRHGARSPHNITKDGIDQFDFKWNIPSGELMTAGQRQHYALGLLFREKYDGFIDRQVKYGDTYIVSTNFNRTIMSALSFIQGLYSEGKKINDSQLKYSNPPRFPISKSKDDEEVSNRLKDIEYSNINKAETYPLYIINDGEPFYEINKKRFCDGYPELFEEYPKGRSENIMNLYYRQEKVLSNKFNISISKLNPLESKNKLYYLADGYISAYFQGHDLAGKFFNGDEEQAKIMLDDLTTYFTRDLTWGTLGDDYSKLARYTKSRLMRLIMERMDNRIKSSEYTIENTKMYLFFMHDRDLAEIMVLLKYVFNSNLEDIKFASYYSFELLLFNKTDSLDKNDYYIRIVYDSKPVLTIKYEDFSKMLLAVLVDDISIDYFCSKNNNDLIIGLTFMIVILIGSITSFILMLNKIFNISHQSKGEDRDDFENNQGSAETLKTKMSME